MVTDLNIEVAPLPRVEGHGELVLDIEGKKIKKLNFRIPESPRFFEAMLVGRNYDEPSHITSRICGICAVSHTFASIKATEKAIRAGMFAFIRPVITSTLGRWVAKIRCIPTARAICASLIIPASTSLPAVAIRSASSSTINTICGILLFG